MPPKKKQLPPVDATRMINMYDHVPKHLLPDVENPNVDLHGFEIPFRAVVVAPSGTGKTNFVVNVINLFNARNGTFSSINIVTRNKDEPLYNTLLEWSNQIVISEGVNNLPNIDEFDKQENHLVIIDDLVLDKHQKPIEDYYIRCRKMGVSVMYLAQSYYAIPRMIRQNVSYLIILKLSNQRDVTTILKESGLGLTKDQLVDIYERATAKKMDCLIVNLTEADQTKKFRRNFLDYLTPKSIDGKGLTSSKVAPMHSEEPVALEPTPRQYRPPVEEPPVEEKKLIYTTGDYDTDWPDPVERINKNMLFHKKSDFEYMEDLYDYIQRLYDSIEAIDEQFKLMNAHYSHKIPSPKLKSDIEALRHNRNVIVTVIYNLEQIHKKTQHYRNLRSQNA